jgi:HlyD family secretion protein
VKKRAILPLLGLALAALTACQPRAAPTFQGWIEADMIFVGAEDSGRLVQLLVDEGRQVAPGDPLFGIDPATQTADVEAARAALAEARSRLSNLEAAQKRPEEVAVLESTVRRAEATLDYSSADLERARTLVAKGISSRSRLDQAQSTFDRDKAALDEARHQIEVGRLAGRVEDISAARSAVVQAEARLNAAEVKLHRLDVVSTIAGRVEQVYFRPGEVVPNGRPVVAILPPQNLKVRFFVAQEILPKLKIGDTVLVSCDGCPAGLTANVSFLAAQAEFTPPVIYSLEERKKLVFKVEARPARPDAFRVGQPVSVALSSGPEARGSDDAPKP